MPSPPQLRRVIGFIGPVTSLILLTPASALAGPASPPPADSINISVVIPPGLSAAPPPAPLVPPEISHVGHLVALSTGAFPWVAVATAGLFLCLALIIWRVGITRALRLAPWAVGLPAIFGIALALTNTTDQAVTSARTSTATPERQLSALPAALTQPDVAVISSAGERLPLESPMTSGDEVTVVASGFDPLEVVSVDHHSVRADEHGIVNYVVRLNSSKNILLRGQKVVATWNATVL